MRLPELEGIGRDAGRSITTSDPLSVISPSAVEAIVRDISEATWEEMELIGAAPHPSADRPGAEPDAQGPEIGS